MEAILTHLRKIRNTQLRFLFLNLSFICQSSLRWSETISRFHALSIDKCMSCLQMPPVFLDSMKIFMFESIKIGEESIKLDRIEKVVKTSKFVQG